MSERMEQVGEVASRLDVLRNIAAKAWPTGVVVGFCRHCQKEHEYDWDQMAKMMARGLPRHCGERIDFKR